MRDIERMCEIVEEELGKIADKGLTTGNLETAYKLIDMYKDLKNTKYWDIKSDYYMSVLSEMQGGGYSEAGYSNNGYSMEGGYSGESGGYGNRGGNRGGGRGYSREGGNGGGYSQGSSYANRGQHYVRGHYSRNDGHDPYMDYMDGKQSYRNSGKSEDCKKRMLEALEDHLEMLTKEINEMGQDADCREERETIKRYVDKLRNMM